MPVLLQPESRGRISLKSANPFHWPRMEPNFYTHPIDLAKLIDGIRIVFIINNFVKHVYNFETISEC